jgi:hypothetical protein
MSDGQTRHLSTILWMINLPSIAASVFSYLYLSYFVYQKTKSILLSEIVLIAPMVIPVVLCFQINKIASLTSPRQILIAFNVLGIATALLTYSSIDTWIYAAIAGALIIGFLDSIQRVARMVAIKRYFSTADLKYAVPLTMTAQFVAGGVAGVGLAFYRNDMSPLIAGTIATGGFALASFAAWLLPRTAQDAASTQFQPTGNAFAILGRLLGQDVALRQRFFAFLVFVGVFQGFFNVSRVILPSHVLQLPQSFVGYLQIISSLSALAGALVFVFFGKYHFTLGRFSITALSLISLICMIGATAISNVIICYFLYAMYIFTWEILFFKYQSDLVAVTPPQHMALVATFQFAGIYLGMIIASILGGLIIEHSNITMAALIFAAVYAMSMVLGSFRSRQASASEPV